MTPADGEGDIDPEEYGRCKASNQDKENMNNQKAAMLENHFGIDCFLDRSAPGRNNAPEGASQLSTLRHVPIMGQVYLRKSLAIANAAALPYVMDPVKWRTRLSDKKCSIRKASWVKGR